jgi:tape measure domain-containing protein
MAIDITTIGIEYDTSGLEKGTRAQDKTTDSANKMGGAADRAKSAFDGLSRALKYLGAALIVKELVQMADAVTLMDARLKLAAGSSKDFAKAQKDIYAIAQANNVGLQETTALYTKLYEPVKRLGGGTKEATAIVDAFATSLRVGGAGAQEAASATLQFAQAMGSGKLQGDEFRSMAEASPRFMKALAEGMGVPIETLKKMGTEGKLTADVVGNALIKSLDQLKQEALSLPDTVGGALTRFKNDIIIAVGEINNSEGFSMGFAGMIEGARQLIPTIKDELAGALSKVSEWFSWIKDDVLEVWDNVKGLIGDVWNLAKPFVEITAIIAGAIIKTGVFGDLLKMARVMVAGLYDGFTFIGGVLAGIGSKIMQFVLSPLTFVLEKSAQIAGVFNEDLANKIRGVNKNISDFTGAGSEYAASVVDAFGRGDSALMRLDKSLKEGVAQTKEVTKATIDADGGYTDLAGSVAKTEKKTKGLTIAEQALNFQRKQGYKLGLEMAKDSDKSMEQFAKDQINRTKEVTKSIIDSISEQGKNYLSLKTKLDQYTDSLKESNDLSKLEMSLIGSSNSERQIAIEQYKIALTLKKQLAEIDEKNLSQGEKSILVQEAQTAANLAKSQVELKVQQTEWTSFFSDIYTGLSDSLYRSFESGKGFAKTFIDSLKNLFKTNVIKIAVQAVMGGGLSLSGLASAETGAGSMGGMGGVSSYLSMGKSIYEGFSSGFSGFGNSVANYVQTGLDKAGLSMTSGGNSAFATGAGTVASYGAGIAAGVYGGRAISAGYGSNSTVNVGTALGAILGGPIGAAIGGAIGGGLNRLFGMKAKEITSQTVSGNLGGNINYGETTFQKGGIFRSDKYGSSSTSLQSKDADLFNGLNSAYDELKASTGSFATALGLNADVILSRTDAINFSIGKTKEETQKAIETAFLSISDSMAISLIPSIASMTKEGETASQALQRVAISFSSANSVFANLNLQLFSVNDAGYKASAIFIELVGGLEGLQSVTQSYYDTYFTEAEKTQKILDAVTSEFAKQNLALPDSIAGYRALVEEISKTGTPEQLAALLNMNQAFASIVVTADQVTEASKAAAAAAAEALAMQSAISQERAGLQAEYDNLTLSEEEKLQRKRDALYSDNQGLFDQIQGKYAEIEVSKLAAIAYEEQRKAQEIALASQQKAEIEAMAAIKKAEDDAFNAQYQAAKAIVDVWSSASKSIIDEVKRIRGEISTSGSNSFGAAQSQFAISTAQARAGDIEAAKLLPSLSQALLSIAETQSSSLLELNLIRAQTSQSLVDTLMMVQSSTGIGLPSFAIGTNYVPHDMIAQIHEGEAIVPKAYNNNSSEADKTLISTLIQRVEMLSFELKAIAGHTASTARTLDRVVIDDKMQIGTPANDPIETTVV